MTFRARPLARSTDKPAGPVLQAPTSLTSPPRPISPGRRFSYSSGSVSESGSTQDVQLGYNASANGGTNVDSSALARTLTSNPTSLSPVYFSFLFRGNNSTANEFVQLGLSNSAAGAGGQPLLSVGIAQNTTSGVLNFFGRIGTGASSFSTSLFNANSTYLIVGKVSSVSGTGSTDYNRVDLFINPTSGTEPSPTYTVSGVDSTIKTISSFNVRTARFSTTDVYSIDNVSLGSTFADVVPTPEPGSLALLGLGAAGLLRRKRRGG